MLDNKDFGDGEIIESKVVGKVFKLSSYNKNPILTPQVLNITKGNAAIFNPGAEIFENRIILVPRCHTGYKKVRFFDDSLKIERIGMENYLSEIRFFSSQDGEHFNPIKNQVLKGDGSIHPAPMLKSCGVSNNTSINNLRNNMHRCGARKDFSYGIEDIRIIRAKTPEEIYFLIGCGKIKRPFFDHNADRIAIYSTKDFKNITYHGIIKDFDCRNAVPFPEYINNRLYMFFRLRPNIHLVELEKGFEQLLNPHRHEKIWDKIYNNKDKTVFIKTGEFAHSRERVGPGPQLIKTTKGWLFIYFSVGKINKDITHLYGLSKEIERGYSISCALLDLENPFKILCRTKIPIYIPSHDYELFGSEQYPVDVPYVVFPIGAIQINNKLLIYCGAGDKYCIVLSCDVNNLLDYLLKYCLR